jgi:hypothetical protein
VAAKAGFTPVGCREGTVLLAIKAALPLLAALRRRNFDLRNIYSSSNDY